MSVEIYLLSKESSTLLHKVEKRGHLSFRSILSDLCFTKEENSILGLT
jgi:hypothetical protein